MSAPWSYPIGKSVCCEADVYEDGICKDCGEHADLIEDEEEETPATEIVV